MWRQALVTISRLPEFLDWLLAVIEPLIVIVSAIGYGGYWLAFGPETDPRHARMLALLTAVDENWKVVVLLAVPLFYRTVRRFLEQVEELWGVKRPRRVAQVERAPNPPGI